MVDLTLDAEINYMYQSHGKDAKRTALVECKFSSL